MDRRGFNTGVMTALAGATLPFSVRAAPYAGPNVILVRFGGGVRRAETIDEAATFAPYLRHVLVPQGTFIPDMRIAQLDGVNTSHAEGTLNLLTGRYLAYRDAGSEFLNDRLEPTEPTLFEYLRDAFDLPSHQVLLINGEDRPQEEFFTYGVADHYGINFRSEMLSLHRFKLYKFAQILAERRLDDAALQAAQAAYDALLAKDPRAFAPAQSPQVTAFWARWRAHYGDDGFRNPRGDRLLTALALRALAELQPRLMMVNYQDTDYVHWGNPSHYTRAIQIIDDGLQRLVEAVQANPAYRDNTVFVITPDCGRDANPLLGVPFQHHFNTASAHETWALIFGAGVQAGRVIDRPVDQSAIAPTIAALMGFAATQAEGDTLTGIFR
ncbi:MAG: sulfatase-like hydrolase/transferase [Rhodobacteraceae bacterium]|nr:sulfatase-like hydrolase/transferase [Paracoccaceae bacterium]